MFSPDPVLDQIFPFKFGSIKAVASADVLTGTISNSTRSIHFSVHFAKREKSS
jgi:hypothetical protein